LIKYYENKNIYAFTRDGDSTAQDFALKMGACWSGGSADSTPVKLDAAIIFAPAGELIPKALKDVDKSGEVICGGIHMSEIPAFSYDLLWEERMLKSVANLTRTNGIEFFELLKGISVETQTTLFELQQANETLDKFRKGEISGAAVLVMG
jgi:propanol-preferring alcohol dehydrogenase